MTVERSLFAWYAAGPRAELGLELPDQALARGVLAWAALFGCVSFEVFGQYGPDTFALDPPQLTSRH